ncbi:MAG: GH92 family glycosyl hydrolase [Candidatus Aminicenantes bacterium]|jgi:predicted alpha-1,2-mannosidase
MSAVNLTKRYVKTGCFILGLFTLMVCSKKGELNLVDFVDPFIGTDGHGHTYPGASLPFGMVQLSPDTRLTGWDGCSGYHYSDDAVYGFSHTHLSGTGVSDYGDILFMPTVGKVQLQRGSDEDTASGYCSKFSHNREEASPGYYRVWLEDYGVNVELTVTRRAGFHKYTYPQTQEANIIIDLTHRDPVIESSVRFVNETEIEGMRRSCAWAKDQTVYFVAKFSKPFKASGIAIDNRLEEGCAEAKGTNIKGYVRFQTEKDEHILVKVGISAVSSEGARKNLDAEIMDWDFSRIRTESRAEWNSFLRKIIVGGKNRESIKVFYTALYHALLSPNLFMDVDGQYRGTDLKIHSAQDFENYTVFSLWDTFRAAFPLLTIIEPDRTVDFIRTLLAQYENGGTLPMWELAGNDTGCMIGYHAVPVITDAYVKGIRGFDAEKALEAMKHSADQDHLGLKYYKTLGYIPADRESESVSKTLEYSYDDWCIAQMAKLLNKMEDYRTYIQRAQSYKNLFDPSTGFMRAKMNSSWFVPFDPLEVNFNYTEANSWQYNFFAPHDIEGLIKLMGGKLKFSAKLDKLFALDARITGREQVDISGLIGQYAHGNEPSHHMAYLFNYVNQPWITQQKVREIMHTLYTSRPDGLCGNDDCGQMSAWYVLSALGFYPVCPGQDMYVMGTPLFPRAVIDVGGGKTFVIQAKRLSPYNIYIQEAFLNGKTYNKSYLKHADIVKGGELTFIMGGAPNTEWGTSSDEIPSSSISEYKVLPVPYVSTGSRTFTESTQIILATVDENAKIYYTTDGKEPTLRSSVYSESFLLTETTTIKMFAYKEGMPRSFTVTAQFKKIPSGRSLTLQSSYSSQYSAGGKDALIDTLRGPADFRTGFWQGYHGVDLEAVVDLGVSKTIRRITTGFLQDLNSWIFMPLEVKYSVSENGIDFRPAASVSSEVSEREEGVIIKDFTAFLGGLKARYVKVKAVNRAICPAWHKGAGEKAWVFADEIIIQ